MHGVVRAGVVRGLKPRHSRERAAEAAAGSKSICGMWLRAGRVFRFRPIGGSCATVGGWRGQRAPPHPIRRVTSATRCRSDVQRRSGLDTPEKLSVLGGHLTIAAARIGAHAVVVGEVASREAASDVHGPTIAVVAMGARGQDKRDELARAVMRRSTMTKTERAVDATAAAVRSAAAGAAESRRARASRYATVAKMAAAAAGIGGAAEAVDAAIISGTTAVVLTSPALGATPNTTHINNVGIGDALLANAFNGAFLQQTNVIVNSVPNRNLRRAFIQVASTSTLMGRPNGVIHQNLLGSGAVVGTGMNFGTNYFEFGNRSTGASQGSVAAITGYPVVMTSNSVRGFVGFRFDNGGNDNFGYFDVEWSRTGVGQGSTLTLTIHGWAYDNSGAAITIGGATPIPGGTGLAALAIGAVGLRGRRRSRN